MDFLSIINTGGTAGSLSSRRRLIKSLSAVSAYGLARAFRVRAPALWAAANIADDALAVAENGSEPFLAGRPLVRYPEKADLILLTSRPPQLETPVSYFDRAITPNEAFYVRYHVFPVPTQADLATWRLRITGLVDTPLELSMDDLKAKFPPQGLLPFSNVPAIAAGECRRTRLAANGATAPWGMPSGWAHAWRTF